MSANAPQTLSVKRKRTDVPVQHLVVAAESKRQTTDSTGKKRKIAQSANDATKRTKTDSSEGTVVWRLSRSVKVSYDVNARAAPETTPDTPARRFHISRTQGNVHLFERKAPDGDQQKSKKDEGGEHLSHDKSNKEEPVVHQPSTPVPPRKRPGRQPFPRPAAVAHFNTSNGPSEEVIRQFEKFSAEVESGIISPSKIKPKAPKLRFRERHPEQADEKDPDAMDLDADDYVYDTYIREIIMPDADGKVPEPEGTVGYIVLTEEDEGWWYAEDASDKEFDTDDEDSNAEEYYANDYPEDEMSSDDEFDRHPYSYCHDENDEEYDLENDVRSDDDEEVKPFKQVQPTPSVYWGQAGEQ